MAEQRLIDANNLIEEIREEYCYNCIRFKDLDCEDCGKQEGCLEICVREHRDGAKYGRADNGC